MKLTPPDKGVTASHSTAVDSTRRLGSVDSTRRLGS